MTPWERTLSTDAENRSGVIKVIEQYCHSLPVDSAYKVTIEPQDETRGASQNRLMWQWNSDAGKAQGWSADRQHGEWKHDVLLPMMKAWPDMHARAMFIQSLLDEMPSRTMVVFACYDLIRSSDLSIKRFAEALTAYRDHYAQQGIVLQSREDLLAQALGDQYGSQAA